MPLYFGMNPIMPSDRGFSIGHSLTTRNVEIRMFDASRPNLNHNALNPDPLRKNSHEFAGVLFTFPKEFATFFQNTLEITCVNGAAGRICSVLANGLQTTPASALITGRMNPDKTTERPLKLTPRNDIYGGNGGAFGSLDRLAVASPGAGCIKYGGRVVDDPTTLELDEDKALTFDCPTTTTTTATTATTTRTSTTNTHFQNLHSGLDAKVSAMVDLLEQQIEKSATQEQLMAEQLASLTERTDATIAALQAEVSSLKATLGKLAEPDQSNPDDGNGGASPSVCNNADGSGAAAPEIVAGDDGVLALRACGPAGSIELHSGQCSFDPCKAQQELRHLKLKLQTLGNL
eukprot:gene13149-25092_t